MCAIITKDTWSRQIKKPIKVICMREVRDRNRSSSRVDIFSPFTGTRWEIGELKVDLKHRYMRTKIRFNRNMLIKQGFFHTFKKSELKKLIEIRKQHRWFEIFEAEIPAGSVVVDKNARVTYSYDYIEGMKVVLTNQLKLTRRLT